MIAHHSSDQDGFTILEIVLTLVLISIFAVVAVIRQPPTDVTLKAQVLSLKSHFRYAQMRALNTDTAWGIKIDIPAQKYWLFMDTESTKRVLPGEDQVDITLSDKGITISIAGGVTDSVTFDTWGRPNIDNDYSIQLTKTGQTENLTIATNTGFIE